MDFNGVIKAAVEAQVKALNGVEAAAAMVGIGKTQLANYYHPDRAERVPLVVAMRLDEVAGEPMILARAAALLGYRLERLDESADGDITAALGALAHAAGQVVSEGIKAGADHVYTQTERRHLFQLVADLQNVEASLVRALGEGGQ